MLLVLPEQTYAYNEYICLYDDRSNLRALLMDGGMIKTVEEELFILCDVGICRTWLNMFIMLMNIG